MRLSPLGRKIYAIVNYDNFAIPPELIEPWTEMVKALVDKYYWGVTRYTTSNFLRMKLGDSLAQRGVAPHIYESAEEAHHHLQALAPAASAGEAPDEAL
jgi:propionate CoA-transferase